MMKMIMYNRVNPIELSPNLHEKPYEQVNIDNHTNQDNDSLFDQMLNAEIGNLNKE